MERRLERQIIRELFGRRDRSQRAYHHQNIEGPPAPNVTPPPAARYAFWALDDSDFDDIPGSLTRFAGDPPYESWVAVASTTPARLANWRAAFPGTPILAYVDVYHMETAPAGGSLYSALVPLLTQDNWLRYVSAGFHQDQQGNPVAHAANEQVIRFPSPNRGYYFWSNAMLDVLTNWLLTTNIGGSPILTKFDGLAIDNLSDATAQSVSQAGWQSLINRSGGNLKVNSQANPISAAQLAALYAQSSPAITTKIRAAMSQGDLIWCNSGDPSRTDSQINGCLWEPIATNADLDGDAFGWQTPHLGGQYVSTEEQWAAIQKEAWEPYVVFVQATNMRPNGRLP